MELKTEQYWIPKYNYIDEVRKDFHMQDRVLIHDVTLREGDQTPGCVFRTEEKFELAKDLDDLGVDSVELFSVVSPEDQEALKELTKPGVLKHAKVMSLSRAKASDIDTAAKCGVYKVSVEGPGNMFTAKYMLGVTDEDQLIKQFCDAIKYAKSQGLVVSTGAWDCCKSDLRFLEKVVKSTVEAGATEIVFADTFGFTLPWAVQYMIGKYREWVGPDIRLDVHFHNDYGLATANSLAAVAAGANCVHVAMNGLGERVGNASLAEVALNLALNMGVKTDIKLNKIYPLSKKIEAISKIPIDRTQPVIGQGVYELGSGLPVDTMKKMRPDHCEQYTMPYAPSLVGGPDLKLVYGKGVGKSMVADLIEQMGLTATKEQVAEITARIKSEAHMMKSLLSEFQVQHLIKEHLGVN